MQRRTTDREALQLDAPYQFTKDRQRVSRRREGQLGAFAGVAHGGDAGQVVQGAAVAVVFDDNGVFLRVTHLREAAVEHLAALVHQDDAITELLGLIHHVGREEDGLALPLHAEDGVANEVDVDRIEARERLV